VISATGGDTLTLKNTKLDALNNHDFHFSNGFPSPDACGSYLDPALRPAALIGPLAALPRDIFVRVEDTPLLPAKIRECCSPCSCAYIGSRVKPPRCSRQRVGS
jgi:hypothetical protein